MRSSEGHSGREGQVGQLNVKEGWTEAQEGGKALVSFLLVPITSRPTDGYRLPMEVGM